MLRITGALLIALMLAGCGGGSDGESGDGDLGATNLNAYHPVQNSITVGCQTDGSMPREDTTDANGTVTYGMGTFISRINVDLLDWYLPNWQIAAQVVDGPGDGRFAIVFTNHPVVDAQGYSLQVGSQWQCTCNMPKSLAEGTPFTSASHELYNTLVMVSGGPKICGPVAPLCGPDLLTDATTRSYWAAGDPPYDKLTKLQGAYPTCVAGGAIGQ